MNFDMYSGNAKVLVFTVYDKPNGDVVNITGATAVKFQIFHDSPATGDPVVSKTLGSGITLSDPTNGQFTVTLTSVNTSGFSGRYYYEAEVTDSSSRVETVATGYINITLKRITYRFKIQSIPYGVLGLKRYRPE